ncbi:hypothetical protein CVT24_005700 [Panaeolus cyanescens]|uniref:Uncharacterized protein n=1 Tax=Panaeolus cyanescens TaxID=181874 RepID=A0A409VDP2_9AGAR|nr:hypothetical protein CVT24_005700 [Panaeolus cyanescens]
MTTQSGPQIDNSADSASSSLSDGLEVAYCYPSKPSHTSLTEIEDLDAHNFAQLLLNVIKDGIRAKLTSWFCLQLNVNGQIFMSLDEQALLALSDNDRETYCCFDLLQKHPYNFISPVKPFLPERQTGIQFRLDELLDIHSKLKSVSGDAPTEAPPDRSTIQSGGVVHLDQDPRHFLPHFEASASLARQANGHELDLAAQIAIQDAISRVETPELINACHTSTEAFSGTLDDKPTSGEYPGAALLDSSPQCLTTTISQSPSVHSQRRILQPEDHSYILMQTDKNREEYASPLPCHSLPPSMYVRPTTRHADPDSTLSTTQDSTAILRHGYLAIEMGNSGEITSHKFGDKMLIETSHQSGDHSFGTDDPYLPPISVNLNRVWDPPGDAEHTDCDIERTFESATATRSIPSAEIDIFQNFEITAHSSPKRNQADLSGASGHINELLSLELDSQRPLDTFSPHSDCPKSSLSAGVGVIRYTDDLTLVASSSVQEHIHDFCDKHLPTQTVCDERSPGYRTPPSVYERRLVNSAIITSPSGDLSYSPALSSKLYSLEPSSLTRYDGDILSHERSSDVMSNATALSPLEFLRSNDHLALDPSLNQPKEHPLTCYLNPGINLNRSKHTSPKFSTDKISPTNLPHLTCDPLIFGLAYPSVGLMPYLRTARLRTLTMQASKLSDQGDIHESQEYIGGDGSDRSHPSSPSKQSEAMALPPVHVSPHDWSLQEEIFSCLSFDNFREPNVACVIAEDSPMRKSPVANNDERELSVEAGRSLRTTYNHLFPVPPGHECLNRAVQNEGLVVSQHRPKLQRLKMPQQMHAIYTDVAVQTVDIPTPSAEPLSGPAELSPQSFLSYSSISAPTRHILNGLVALFSPTLIKELENTSPILPAMRRRTRVQIEKGCIYPAFKGPMSAIAKET